MTRWTKRLSTLAFGIYLTIIFSTGVFAVSNTKVLYVANDGNDSWTGEIPSPNRDHTDGPLATPEGARNKIRNLRTYGKLPYPVTVQVRGGTYRLDRTFVLEAQDSGSKECPITFMAYPAEKVVISGGKRIEGPWTKYKDNIVMCTIPKTSEGAWYFRDLFVNGRRQIRARTPNEGFFYIAGLISGEKPGEFSRSSFKYDSDNLKRWRNLSDVELLILESWDGSRINISDIDEEKRIVTLVEDNHYPFTMWTRFYKPFFKQNYARYFVENVFEGLDSPGEWYLDKPTNTLYYLPQPGTKVEDLEVIAPVINCIVSLKGDSINQKPVSYITFSGFTFCETDWPAGFQGYFGDELKPAALSLSYAEHCTIEKNIITNVGTYAIENIDGSAYNVFDRNEISYTGSGGIRIGDSFFYENGIYVKDAYIANGYAKRNIISNNHIHHCGIIHPAGIGIITGCSPENRIAHNHIHDIGYCGMSLRGFPSAGNIVEYNHVHHVMQRLCDGAALFTFGEHTDGMMIRNNLFHDVKPFGFFGWGIYLDYRSENITVMDNIVYRCQWGNSMLGAGSNRTSWINNIFVNANDGQIYWLPNKVQSDQNRYLHNIVYFSDPKAYLINCTENSIRNAVIEMDYNLYFFTRGGAKDMEIRSWDATAEELEAREVRTYNDWQKLGFDFHSIIADPLFVDPANDNYTLRKDSPAFKLGFRQIDISTVGPQD